MMDNSETPGLLVLKRDCIEFHSQIGPSKEVIKKMKKIDQELFLNDILKA